MRTEMKDFAKEYVIGTFLSAVRVLDKNSFKVEALKCEKCGEYVLKRGKHFEEKGHVKYKDVTLNVSFEIEEIDTK